MTIIDADFRLQLLRRLQGVGAHMPYDQAVKDFPMDRINEKFRNGTYSAYGVLEHLRYTQWDMLDYCKNPDYQHGNWPNDYWPDPGYKATPEDWQKSIDAFLSDRAEFEATSIPIATQAERVAEVMRSCYDGRRIVLFSGGAEKDAGAVLEDARAIRAGGGNGSIIGRNCFRRPRADALTLIDEMIAAFK